MDRKILLGIIGALIVVFAFSVISASAFAAWNIITNMTPATTSGGFIGNSTQNYTFSGLYYGTWLGASPEILWQGNYSLVAFIANQGNWNVNSSTWWAGLNAVPSAWGLWATDKPNYINTTSSVITAITGIGIQAQNLNMSSHNITMGSGNCITGPSNNGICFA